MTFIENDTKLLKRRLVFLSIKVLGMTAQVVMKSETVTGTCEFRKEVEQEIFSVRNNFFFLFLNIADKFLL